MPDKPQTHRFPDPAPPEKQSLVYDHAWRKFREQYAAEVPMVCVRCDVALEARLMHLDHIVPIEQGGARLDKNNVQWLCYRCHNSKTATEDGGGFGNAK